MSELKLRAKVEKIEGNKVFYSLPTRIYSPIPRKIERSEAVDPANLKKDFLELVKTTYVGNKRRIKEKIISLVPEEVKTVFDPMCGFSVILRELAEKGKEVRGNDLNLIAYYYSRAFFLKEKPSFEEATEFIKSFKRKKGYFAASDFWSSVKIPLAYKEFVDGFIISARESKFPAFYLGVAAAYLGRIGPFGGPYDPERVDFFRISGLREDLLFEARKLINFKGVGRITCQDARTMTIPQADLIYFDPPYADEFPLYFKRYSKINSILLQDNWEIPKEIKQTEVAEIARKLQQHTDLLIVSSSPDCPLDWRKELSDPRREIFLKRIQVKGGGLENAAVTLNQKVFSEHLWVSVKKSLSEIVKTGDPFMLYPPEDETYRYVIQCHFRGRTVHWDLRMESLQKKYLIGWTVLVQKLGAIKEPVLTMEQAKRIVSNSKDYFKVDFQTGEWAKRRKVGMKPGHYTNVSLVATRKAVEPKSWMDFEGVTAKGSVGGTKNYPGVFIIVDKGKVEYGSQKSWLHEYFMDGKILKKGRYFFRQLKAWKKKSSEKKLTLIENENLWKHLKDLNREAMEVLESQGMTEQEIKGWILPQLSEAQRELNLSQKEIMNAFVLPPGKEEGLGPEFGWLMIKPVDQTPYTLSQRAIDEDWLPPKGFSALPRHWRKEVKLEEKYWEKDGKAALESRKLLVQRLKKEGVLRRAEEGEVDPFRSKKIEKKEKNYRLDQCMKCTKPPVVEILWAEGMAHAWFCEKHFRDWLKRPGAFSEICSVKLTKDEKASKRFKDNPNGNIKYKLKEYFPGLKIEKSEKEEPLDLSADSKSEFRLTYQWWRGPIIVRLGPSRFRYHIWFKQEKKILDFSVNDNILEVDKTGGILYTDRTESDYEKTGYVKPGTKLNPTKDTPSFIKLLDKGKVDILIDSPKVKKVKFFGSKLKGMFLFTNVESYWSIKRVQESPEKAR